MADLSAQLEQLASLREAGHLSDEEFATQRDALVASGLGRTPRAASAPATASRAAASASGRHPAHAMAGTRPWLRTAVFLGAGAVIATIWTFSTGSSAPGVSVDASAREGAFQDASDGSVAADVDLPGASGPLGRHRRRRYWCVGSGSHLRPMPLAREQNAS